MGAAFSSCYGEEDFNSALPQATITNQSQIQEPASLTTNQKSLKNDENNNSVKQQVEEDDDKDNENDDNEPQQITEAILKPSNSKSKTKPLSLSSAKPAIVVDNNTTRGINNIEKKKSKLNQEPQEEDEQQPQQQQQENDQQSEAESSWNNDDNWDDMDQSDNNETFNNSNATATTTANIPEELMDESLPIELTTAIDDDDDFVDPFLRKQPARTPTKATKPKVNPLLPKPEDEIDFFSDMTPEVVDASQRAEVPEPSQQTTQRLQLDADIDDDVDGGAWDEADI